VAGRLSRLRADAQIREDRELRLRDGRAIRCRGILCLLDARVLGERQLERLIEGDDSWRRRRGLRGLLCAESARDARRRENGRDNSRAESLVSMYCTHWKSPQMNQRYSYRSA